MKQKKTSTIRINKVYTKSGDKGKTCLIDGEKKWKDDVRIEAYGSVDELNSHIGLCRELLKNNIENDFNQLIDFLQFVQNQLFNLGTQLATSKNIENIPKLSNNAIQRLENEIDSKNSLLSDLKSFVLPGGNIIGAHFHIARCVCRRAERRVISLLKNKDINSINLIFLNRLSDALFVWSRWVVLQCNDPENLWNPE